MTIQTKSQTVGAKLASFFHEYTYTLAGYRWLSINGYNVTKDAGGTTIIAERHENSNDLGLTKIEPQKSAALAFNRLASIAVSSATICAAALAGGAVISGHGNGAAMITAGMTILNLLVAAYTHSMADKQVQAYENSETVRALRPAAHKM